MIEKEIASFERMQAELSQRYGSQYVAIYRGKVVEHGPDRLILTEQVYAQFGAVPFFVERADATEPRIAKMPSIRIAKRMPL
ncbi:MAG: hypothetical protein IT327_32520 [Anaerolineae bacterium]|nr:hypothetical protein [Anaerolineae bacterium]